ncbi:folic acid synthesis protein-like protein [Westerdykella ornata]|uniref:Folic acid synthesis protein FOL1 n=1 Tax=Westerdykella ornata TaxID=318751 RepID=A0A6A6JSB1_WESOR|nr:folic acid synthesis protein-like protein [Westerdykella ornata]KAF2278616.1 folic acid synthesis protein-like protein [Westerdykella ornata]
MPGPISPIPQRQIRNFHAFPAMAQRAYIALGSNLGDRVTAIEKALRHMEAGGNIKVLRTSSLWETQAMYVLDQNKFINGVCEIETTLPPMQLLDELQAIENKMGRVKVIDKGPRNIDLDILLYGDHVLSNERLQIPHKLMLEREFVLRPLCELIPQATLPPQSSLPRTTLQEHLSALPPQETPISPLTPLALSQSSTPDMPTLTPYSPSRRTLIMSILNLTPDSFSDGGRHFNLPPSTLMQTIHSHLASGAHILDLGGQSTRPHAPQVSAEEELSRLLPALKTITSLAETRNTAISIDTYRASVARAAVQAGAHIINDVSAGLLDPDMLPTVAELGCTICLMHMRGNPDTMNDLTSYPDGVIHGIGRELLDRVREAEKAGIRRWRIILDPGIGFAKTQDQNLEVLRRLDDLRRYPGLEGFPWLIGTSRKAFIGRITGVEEARERTWGTAAAVTAAVQGGADVVRVHDVGEMAKVVSMADAIWRV